MEKDQKIYEIGYLFSPLIPEEKIDEEVSVLRKLIESRNSFIMSEERPKNHKLAYPIKKFNTAYFGWFKILASPESVSEIKNSFDKSEKVIRFLIIKIIKEAEQPFRPVRKRILKTRKPSIEAKEKPELKTEEIDKKLEELLGSSPKI